MTIASTPVTDYGDVLAGLAAVLEERVERSATTTGVPAPTLEDLHQSGLYRMRVPACLGGGAADARTCYEVVERLSYIDGATGWTFMAGANLLGLAGAFLDDDAVTTILSDPRACIAGQVAARGKAEATADGYRVEGTFGFGSGAPHSTYMMGGFRETRDGEPVRTAIGMPNVLAAVIPREHVEFLGNWDVLGLQATASLDYRIPEQIIDPGFTWPLFTGAPRRGESFYRMGIFGVTAIDHSGFSIGVARRALDDVAAVAVGKRRAGRVTLADDPIFQSEYAKAEASLRAARAFVIEAITDLEQAAAQDAVTQQLRARARLAASHAARTSIEVTGVAYRFSGSTGLRNGSAMQQCLRDLTASEAHVFTDHNSWRDTGSALLGTAPADLFL